MSVGVMQNKVYPFGGGNVGGVSTVNKGYADISHIYERNQEATIYVGNLDSKVDEEILWELFIQCGQVKNIHMPRDKITSAHSNYGFVEYETEADADYAIKILNMVKLYGKPIRCNKASQDKKTQEVGANLFIGNLDPEVDEKILYDTFSAFGIILSAKVMRDPDTGESKGYGFVSYDSFESSDACLAAMNSQFLCNRPIHVSYAYKKDTKGERHGCAAERLIAANKPVEKLKSNLGTPNLAATSIPANLPAIPNFQGLPNLPNIPPPPMLSGIQQLPSFPVPTMPMGGATIPQMRPFTNAVGGGMDGATQGGANIPNNSTTGSTNINKNIPPTSFLNNPNNLQAAGRMPSSYGSQGGVPPVYPPVFFPRPGMNFPVGMPSLPNLGSGGNTVPPSAPMQ